MAHEDVDLLSPEQTKRLLQELRVRYSELERQNKELRRHEVSSQRNERLLSLIIEYSPSAIAMFDRDMKYIAANHRYLIDYNLGEQNVIGRSHYEIFPEIPERWKAIHQRCLAGATERAEEDQFPRASGKVDWVRWEIRPWYDGPDEIGGLLLFSEVLTEQKKSEHALQDSEANFLSLAESMPHIVWITRPDGWNIYFNQQWTDYTGLSLEESYGNGWNKPFHPEDQQRAWDAWQNATQNNATYSLQCRLRRHDGIYKWWLIRGVPLLDDKGAVLKWYGTCTDIDELMHVEETLKISEERFQALFNKAPLGYQSLDSDGNFLEVNEQWLNTLGYSRNEVIGKWFGDFLTPMYQDGFRERFPIFKARGLIHSEFEMLHKNGDILFIAFDGRIGYELNGDFKQTHCILQDITERRRSTLLLAQEKERLSVTLRSIGDGVITTDTDGRIVMLNKAAEDLTGWTSDEAAGKPLQEVFVIVSELTHEVCENPVEKVLTTGHMVELANHTCLISKDGREIQIADSGAPIRDTESRIIGVVLVFRDVTERQKLRDSLQRTQKLESIGLLAGGIAHDFNNLLAGIFGYLDLAIVSASTHQTEDISTYLNKALGVYERAKALTQQLLTFSKGGTPIRKTLQIAPLIQHSANFALSGSNVNCHFDLAEDLWPCDCDENQIGQVIDNIIINGKQAMPTGGTISISAVNVANGPGHPGNYIRISIKDQGIGMPKDILPKIFDPFFTTKTQGHGLGLATVYSIIQRHDGWVDVESNPGNGSIFHISLPALQKTQLPISHFRAVTHAGSGSILVMDDEEFMLEIVGSMLKEMGYSVYSAKDGREAIGLFTDAERSGNSFIVTILDLTIPGGMGGKETAKAMRTLNPHSIIVASSGYSEDPVISNPKDHGFTGSIIKPFRKKELTELLVRILELED